MRSQLGGAPTVKIFLPFRYELPIMVDTRYLDVGLKFPTVSEPRRVPDPLRSRLVYLLP